MWAYITDLNYGLLPYFPVLCVLAVIMMLMVIIRIRTVFSYALPHRLKERKAAMKDRERGKAGVRFMEWMATFAGCLFLVSTVSHINCGMCGIARYNAWLSVIPIFAIILFGPDILDAGFVRKATAVTVMCGALITGCIVYVYYPHFAMHAQYTGFTPIAQTVLDRFPGIYDPLPSTFVSRVYHVDGGYEYETPVIYYGEDNYARKILASDKDKEELLKNYRSATNEMRWYNPEGIEKQIERLSDKPGYISAPGRYRVIIRGVE